MPRALQHLHLRFALAAVLGLAWTGALSLRPAATLASADIDACEVAVSAADAGTAAGTGQSLLF